MPVTLRFAVLWRAVGWVLVAGVVAGSLLPDLPTDGTGWDKSNHLLAYGVLMWWFRQAFGTGPLWVVLLLALGVAIECLQALTPHRQFELADIVADFAGVALGWLLAQSVFGRCVAVLDGWLARWLGPASP